MLSLRVRVLGVAIVAGASRALSKGGGGIV